VWPIPVAGWSKARVCSRSLAGTVGSHPAIVVCCQSFLWWADHSSRGVLPNVVYLSVISEPQWGGDLSPLRLSSHKKSVSYESLTIWYDNSNTSSVGATARCGLRPVEQCPSIFPYLSPTLSTSLPSLEDLFLLPLSILSWVFPFISSPPVLEWRSFWASYPPPFSPDDPANLSFAPFIIVIRIFYFRFLQLCLCQNVFVCLGGWEERLLKIVQVQCCVCDCGNNRNFKAVVTVPRQ
jgi:hypothetical protein